MNFLQKASIYGLTIAGLNGLFYDKADSQLINNYKMGESNKYSLNMPYLNSEKSSESPKNYSNLKNKSLEDILQGKDVVYLKNGSIIKGKIVELVPNKSVKIKTADGSLFVYKMDEVEKIDLEEKMEDEHQVAGSKKEVKGNSVKKKYDAQFSFGYGNSFGGFGASIQGNVSDYVALHAGGGYFPLSKVYENAKDMFMAAGGIKTYFSNQESAGRFFLDLQFGTLGGEYKEKTEYFSGSTVSSKEQKALYGPSALLGGELFFSNGDFGLVFAGGASYNMAKVEWKDIKVVGAIDLGFSIRF